MEEQLLFLVPINKKAIRTKSKEDGSSNKQNIGQQTSQRLMNLLKKRQLQSHSKITPDSTPNHSRNLHKLSRLAKRKDKSQQQEDTTKSRHENNLLKDQIQEKLFQQSIDKSIDAINNSINPESKFDRNNQNEKTESKSTSEMTTQKSFWKKQQDNLSNKRNQMRVSLASLELPQIDITEIKPGQMKNTSQDGDLSSPNIQISSPRKATNLNKALDTVISAENDIEEKSIENDNQKEDKISTNENQKNIPSLQQESQQYLKIESNQLIEEKLRKGSHALMDGRKGSRALMESRKGSHALMEDIVVEASRDHDRVRNSQLEEINSFPSSTLTQPKKQQSPIKGLRKKIASISNDVLMNSAIAVLMQKTPEQRNYEDLAVLIKSTRNIPFFQKMEGKVLVIQNICRCIQYQFIPKGTVIFYQGEAADKLFITMKGKIAILTLKRPQDLAQEEASTYQQWQQIPKDKQKLTIRMRFIQRSLVKAVNRLTNTLFFFKALKIKAHVLKQLPLYFSIFKKNQFNINQPLSSFSLAMNSCNNNTPRSIATPNNINTPTNDQTERKTSLFVNLGEQRQSTPSEDSVLKSSSTITVQNKVPSFNQQNKSPNRKRTNLYEVKFFSEEQKVSINQFVNSQIEEHMQKYLLEKKEECQQFKKDMESRMSNFGKEGKSGDHFLNLKLLSVKTNMEYRENFESFVKKTEESQQVNNEEESNTKNKRKKKKNQKAQEKQSESPKNNENSPQKKANKIKFDFNQSSSSDEEQELPAQIIQQQYPDSPRKKKKKPIKMQYFPLEPSPIYQDIISNYKNVSSFNKINFKSESDNISQQFAFENNYEEGIYSSPSPSPKRNQQNQLNKSCQQNSEQNIQDDSDVMEEKLKNQVNPSIQRNAISFEPKDIENKSAAKKLQEMSTIIMKKRKKMKSVVDQFMNSPSNNTFKFYTNIRTQVEQKVKGLNLEILQNGGHFFKNNTFKYNLATLAQDGYVFGEIGTTNKKTRPSTVICLEDCYFATLQNKKYESILMKQEKASLVKKRMFIMETLKRNENQEKKMEDRSVSKSKSDNPSSKGGIKRIGEQPNSEKISKLTYFFQKRKYQAGEIVFSEGEEPKFIYLVKKGEIELQKEEEIEINIKELMKVTIRVAKLTQKEFFGDCDIFFKRRRYFSAVATTAASVYFCESLQFLKFVEESKHFSEGFGERIMKREEYRLKEIENTKITMNFTKNLKDLKFKKELKKISKSMNTSQSQPNLKQSTSPKNLELKPKELMNSKGFSSSIKTEHGMADDEKTIKGNSHQSPKRGQISPSQQDTTQKKDSQKKKITPVTIQAEKHLMTKSAFYSPRVLFSPSKRNDTEDRRNKSPNFISPIKEENKHFRSTSYQEQFSLQKINILPPNIQQPVPQLRLNSRNSLKEEEEESQYSPNHRESYSPRKRDSNSPRKRESNSPRKRQKDSSPKKELEQIIQFSQTVTKIGFGNNFGRGEGGEKDRARKSEKIYSKKIEKDLKVQENEVTSHALEVGNVYGLKYSNSTRNDCHVKETRQFDSSNKSRLASLEHENGPLRKKDLENEDQNEEFISNAQKLKQFRENTKANQQVLKLQRKQINKQSIHDQFMTMREICTLNNILFQKEERVQEQREKALRIELETGIRKKPHHSKMPSEICSIYTKLAEMEDIKGFKQSNLSDSELLIQNPITLFKKTSRHDSDTNKTSLRSTAKATFIDSKRDFSSSKKQKQSTSLHELPKGLLNPLTTADFYQNKEDNNYNLRFSLLQKKGSSSTPISNSQSACLKTSSLFLCNDQTDSIRNLKSTIKYLNDGSKTVRGTDYSHKMLDQISKEAFYKVDSTDQTPRLKISNNPTQSSMNNQLNENFSCIEMPRIHSDRIDNTESKNSSCNNFNTFCLPNKNSSTDTTQTQTKTVAVNSSSIKTAKVATFQNSTGMMASASQICQQIQFDDKQVEKIEQKRFDIKRHYLTQSKITILNHMQKPIIYKTNV